MKQVTSKINYFCCFHTGTIRKWNNKAACSITTTRPMIINKMRAFKLTNYHQNDRGSIPIRVQNIITRNK